MKGLIALKRDTQTLTLYPFPGEMINQRLREILHADNSTIDSIIEYLTESSGKMIRPRLVYITASMAAHDPTVVGDMAVALELIHMASLVHDDIIDHATVRRGQESINQRWNNQVSVLTGDFLFATAFNLISKCGRHDIMENLTTTIRIMCAGEIKQMSLTADLNITEAEYLEKTYGKTACLFASSCKVGALTASLPSESIQNLERFGLCFGYAYQIIDDLLDFLADSNSLGKPVGADLLEGNITLPVIYALQNREYGSQLRFLLESPGFTAQHMPEVIEILVNSQSVAAALQASRQFITRGFQYLNALPPGSSTQELQSMAVYLLETYHEQLNRYDQPITSEVAQ